jgi:hypothetical protein
MIAAVPFAAVRYLDTYADNEPLRLTDRHGHRHPHG